MSKGRKVGEFDYINKTYGLSLKRGTRLKFVDEKDKGLLGKKGTVARSDGSHIMILIDGCLAPTGPFHPTSGILYEDDLKSQEPDLPEHRKLQAVKDRSQAIGEFVNWIMSEKHLEFSFYHTHGPACTGWDDEEEAIDRTVNDHCTLPQESLTPFHMGENQMVKLLAEFFSIDQKKLEDEKEAMLEAIRRKQR